MLTETHAIRMLLMALIAKRGTFKPMFHHFSVKFNWCPAKLLAVSDLLMDLSLTYHLRHIFNRAD